MPLVLGDSGITLALQAIRATALDSNCQLCLFNSNITPAKTDTAGTYTGDEGGFTGYARITLDTWSSVVVASHVAKITELVRVFTRTGGGTPNIYGYFVLDSLNVLLWAEAFPGGPVAMSGAGQTLGVQPVLTFESKYP